MLGTRAGTEGRSGLRPLLGLGDDVGQGRAGGLRVRATPTLVLVNAQGQMLAAWEGVGPEKQQAQITQTLSHSVGPAIAESPSAHCLIRLIAPLPVYQPTGFPFICSSSHALSGAK